MICLTVIFAVDARKTSSTASPRKENARRPEFECERHLQNASHFEADALPVRGAQERCLKVNRLYTI